MKQQIRKLSILNISEKIWNDMQKLTYVLGLKIRVWWYTIQVIPFFSISIGTGKAYWQFHFVCARLIFYVRCMCWIHMYPFFFYFFELANIIYAKFVQDTQKNSKPPKTQGLNLKGTCI